MGCPLRLMPPGHDIGLSTMPAAFALLMSLNMLIEFGDGFGFTGSEFTE